MNNELKYLKDYFEKFKKLIQEDTVNEGLITLSRKIKKLPKKK